MNIVVLMSSYNGEKYIRSQIDSIIAQKGKFKIDILVRDDGSDDKTIDILNEYKNKGVLKWYSGKNLGTAHSFIDILCRAKGYDYYAFADQDDYWFVDKLERAVKSLEKICGPGLYFSNAELVDENLNSFGKKVYKKTPKTDLKTLSCSGGILGCSIVINKELAQIVQQKNNPTKMVMHDFYLAELCLALHGKIIADDKATLKYRQHNDNVIGVSASFNGIVKNRIKDIFTKSKVGIDEQAECLLELYEDMMPMDSIVWLQKISKYKENFINRFLLATNSATRYVNTNMAIKIRLSILLGNR